MLSCCCPEDKSSDIKQNLVQKVQQNSPTQKRNTQLSNEYSYKKQKRVQKKVQQGTRPNFQSQPITIQKKMQQLSDVPSEQDAPIKQIFFQKQIKSNLWDFQSQSQIVYYNFEQQNQIFLTFVINKRSKNTQKSSLLENLIKRSSDCLSLVLPANISNFSHEGSHSNINNTNVIFGSLNRNVQRKLSRDEDNYSSKSSSGYFQHRAGQVFQIERLNQVRRAAFDEIYISVQNEFEKQTLKKFCADITERMTLQDLKRINYIFPCYMSVEEIAAVVFQRMRKFMINQNMHKIVSSLMFQIELFETAKGTPISIVSKKKHRSKKNQINDDRQFINIGIGLLMLELAAQNSYRIYSSLINSLKNESLAEYIIIKKTLDKSRSSKQQFLQNLRNLKILNEEDLHLLDISYDSFDRIKQCRLGKNEAAFIIKPALKQKIGKIVQGYNSPGFDNTPVKKQWDDDLKQSQVPVPSVKSLDRGLSESDQLNSLKENDINKANLEDIFGRQDEQQDINITNSPSLEFQIKKYEFQKQDD